MESNHTLSAKDLLPAIERALELAAEKTLRLERRWKASDGAPVFTIAGRYTARSWTQWTQGFQYGNALLCFDLTGNQDLLTAARRHVVDDMAEHLTHTGVHDHGFNNISTYGQLRRLMREGRIPANDWELRFYELALKASGAVQAARWTGLMDGLGYIHSFNGSHSLFIDTIRTLRICCVAHTLGHALQGEQDERTSLLGRVLAHAETSARYNIYYGEGRDQYDVPELRGRTVHEAIFNPASGVFRCPSSQQGYSPFTTWTRGLAWGMLGFAELMEFVQSLPETEFASDGLPGKREAIALLERAARASCDFYIRRGSALDGICYWDTGAPQLYRLGEWQAKPADPYNDWEPVDASAGPIAAQGLIRLGHVLGAAGDVYTQAGLTIAGRLLQEPYLSVQPDHEGLLLHSIYHRPNGWDYVPPGAKVPCGESSMWGDYHLLELCLLITRMANSGYYTFFQAFASAGKKGTEDAG
jgi:unsaturated chondroitin disaccharide hydrolase